MDKNELIFEEYKLYAEQKEHFINRNFATNKFYLIVFLILIFATIYTNNIVFFNKLTATLLFSVIGIIICALWWMNIDSYNTLIRIKFANVLEKIEDQLPVKPFQDEFKGIEDFKNKKIFMFADIQKLISTVGMLFFFAVFISEFTPILIIILNKIFELIRHKGGI